VLVNVRAIGTAYARGYADGRADAREATRATETVCDG
jgi:hypothetical protein